jgi:hypothetical protein
MRFQTMLRTLSRRPAGRVSDVFRNPAQRQGAYDFLEHNTVSPVAVQRAASQAVARHCAEFDSVYLVLDGSSLGLTDEGGTKGFGNIGSRAKGGRGIKVLNALAVGPDGQTLGVVAQSFWVRTDPAGGGYRPLAARESSRWHDTFESARQVLTSHAPETSVHVLIDREGDASLLMHKLLGAGCDFTIRANGTRKLRLRGRKVHLRRWLKKQKPMARHSVAVPAKNAELARTATLAVRAARVEIVLRDHHIQASRTEWLTVIWAREEGGPRRGAIDWMLYTTVEARAASDAIAALERYTYRWRIEEFHRALKRGGGCIEDSQLRSSDAVIKWATFHTIVAGRAQRLRDAARTTPDLPATEELSDEEIEALVVLKASEKRRNETVSSEGLSLKQAVRWIADLGGFTATARSQAPPGVTVIGRGLERIIEAAQIIRALRSSEKKR